MKHTLGHWTSIERVKGRIDIYGPKGEHIAVIKMLPNYTENARLILAAPDLFSAARGALDVIPVGPEKDALIEALLKAEGKNG